MGQNTLGLFAVNPNSKIFARKISDDLDCSVDQLWFAQKIAKALSLREALYSQPYYRLIHAEADQLPGLIIDRFADLLVIQPNAAWVDQAVVVFGGGFERCFETEVHCREWGRPRAGLGRFGRYAIFGLGRDAC
jgi:23S rRNA G2069 N7-methylase RlmK/C1962 C5-methylase RlmI